MKIERQLLSKQYEFMTSSAREVLYSGAFGAGKTRALCERVVQRACVKGAREFLCRKTNVSLKSTTLQTLLKPDGGLPPVLPDGSYIHYKSDQVIQIIGGGEIVYRGLDLTSKIGSLQLTGVNGDEAVEFTEEDYTMLRGRIRVQVEGLQNQINLACNPGTPSHFLAKRFGLTSDAVCAENCHAISTNTFENTFLPQDYIDDLSTLTGVAYKRYVLGQWVGAEGLVYDSWDREKHVVKAKGNWKSAIIGIDDGYVNPFVALLLLIDNDGNIHVRHEVYERKFLIEDKKKAVKNLIEKINEMKDVDLERVLIDPSSADLIEEFIEEDIPANGANNTVFNGIMRVQSILAECNNKKQRLTVHPRCTNLIKEFESYEWKDGDVDEPKKKYDHAMDALRYCVNYIVDNELLDFKLQRF